ncbi:MAG: trypsin-like serine protease [Rhodocyclaceae bacterium]|nr:trypsin-like serine protease [Rhodocyclaceae bacterium]
MTRHLLLSLATALLLASAPARAVVSADGSYPALADASFLDGMAMLISYRNGGGISGCSGSLLAGGSAVLTAAHCLTGADGKASTSKISLSWNGGDTTLWSTSYSIAPGWSGDLDAGNDLAIVHLATPLTGITAYALADTVPTGSHILLAGYGNPGNGTDGSISGFGTLRYGYNEYDADPAFLAAYSSSDSGVFLYDFDDGSATANVFGSTGTPLESMIASGDSGGASFIYRNGSWLLAGVHSFGACLDAGCTPDAIFGNLGGDIAVSGAMASWLSAWVTTVPEPENWALLLSGLIPLAIRGRQRPQRDT